MKPSLFGKLRRDPMAMLGLALLLIILIGVIVIPELSPYRWNDVDGTAKYAPPSAQHWFGTLRTGNDLFTCIWYGGRSSLIFASLAASIYCAVGTVLGLWAGYWGGWVDRLLSGLMSFLHALPFIPVLMLAAFGMAIKGIAMTPILFTSVSLFGFLTAPVLFQVIRLQTQSLMQAEYMQATRVLGLSPSSRIYRHLLPNLVSHVLIGFTHMMAQAILIELMLYFVGIGYTGDAFTPTRPTWGNLVPNVAGLDAFKNYSWATFFPILNIMVVTMALKLTAEGIRTAIATK